MSSEFELVVLRYAAGVEAIMLLLLTIPCPEPIKECLVTVIRSLLRPFSTMVPFCVFLLMDIYWKYETSPTRDSSECCDLLSEHLRHQKSIMKSQQNALLIVSVLIFYWLLYSVTSLLVRIEELNMRNLTPRNRSYSDFPFYHR